MGRADIHAKTSPHLGATLRSLLVAFLGLALIVVPAVPSIAAPSDSVTVRGSGYGHGVGMSQYGARSQAAKGRSANQILTHYYSGSRVQNADVGGNLLVGLTTTDFVRMTVPSSSEDVPVKVGSATLQARPGQAIRIAHITGTTCDITVGSHDTRRVRCDNIRIGLTISPSVVPDTFVKVHRSSTHDVTLGRGVITFRNPENRSGHGNLHARLHIRMQAYLYGLAEMPSSWPSEALKAQAIAGRTYAQRLRLDRGAMDRCSCHIVTTTADQHYTGWGKEGEATYGAKWRRAVDATGDPNGTTGQVVTHNGAIITSFYHSSSHGHTEWSGDIFENDVPWASGVEDPYSVDDDANNPLASWNRSVGYDRITDRLDMTSLRSLRVVDRNRSGSARTLRANGVRGCRDVTRHMASQTLRHWFGLPSHAISSVDVDSQPVSCEWYVGDFNGDGADDVVAFDEPSGTWFVGIATGGNRYEFSTWDVAATRSGWDTHLVGDFNGNGADDILSYHEPTGNWIIRTKNGDSFDHWRWTRFNTRRGWNSHRVGNVEGGSRDAIISFHGGTGNWIVTRVEGGQVRSRVWDQSMTTSGWDTSVADVNGDRRDDVAKYHPRTGKWSVSISTGSTFNTSVWATNKTKSGWEEHLVADMNGDGLADTASYHPGTGNYVVGVSTGSRFHSRVWTNLKAKTGWETHLAADVTGNGRSELVRYHPGTGNWVVTNGPEGRVSNDVWSRFRSRRGWVLHEVADANGDGVEDIASFHRNNTWFVNESTGSRFDWSTWGDLR